MYRKDKYNITLGKEYPTEEVTSACEQAGLGDCVRNTPQGLDLFIDENAVNLSFGQKQSIAIAEKADFVMEIGKETE